jgi:hypothetical protein
MNLRRLFSPLFLLAVLATTGCDTYLDGESKPEGCDQYCTDDYDCPGNQTCEGSACWGIECYSENHSCSAEGSSCQVASECCKGNCNKGVCSTSCSSGADCVSGAQCCNTYSDGKHCGPC